MPDPSIRNTRSESRVAAPFRVASTTIDPVHDLATGGRSYSVSEDDRVLDVSRRGLCMRAASPPDVGTRVLLQLELDDAHEVVDLIGTVRWTRVEYERGEYGGRAVADVGVELLGGSESALRRYDEACANLSRDEPKQCDASDSVAGDGALG